MAPKFIPFEDVEALADIERLARMLNLELHRSGNQLRGICPVHGGDQRTLCISPGVRSRKGSLGVFYCQQDKTGGDRIGLVAHCMEMGQQDAAFFITQQFGAEETVDSTSSTVQVSTVRKDRASEPPAHEKAPQKREPTRQEFDPDAYLSKLVYTPEVAALGISEADASRLGIGLVSTGLHRGRVVFAIRNPDGSISGFVGVNGTDLKLPSRWIAPRRGRPVPDAHGAHTCVYAESNFRYTHRPGSGVN